MTAHRTSFWVAWMIVATLIVTGATWFAALAWRTAGAAGTGYGPHALGGLLAGLVIGRVFERADRRALLVSTSTLASSTIFGVQLRNGLVLWWPDSTTSWSYLAIITLLTLAGGLAGARIPVRTTRDRGQWLVVSALVVLGALGTLVGLLDRSYNALLFLSATVSCCALVQSLAPVRMIWWCGGGAMVFMLIGVDISIREDDFSVLPAIATVTVVMVLAGALGARLGWRVVRKRQAEQPAKLPVASTQ